MRGINTSKVAKNVDLAILKSDIHDLDNDKLKTGPVDLSKLSNVVKADVIKETIYNELVKKVNALQTIDTSELVKKANYNTKLVEIKKKIPGHGKYITTYDFHQFSSIFRRNI